MERITWEKESRCQKNWHTWSDMASGAKAIALIVAAGKGTRMHSEKPKQYLTVQGIPILSRTIQAFDNCSLIDEIVLVHQEGDLTFCRENIIDPYSFEKDIHCVAGGAHRQVSVLNGLMAVKALEGCRPEACFVLIHDGVRPFVTRQMIHMGLQAARETGAAIPVIPVYDTLKKQETSSGLLVTEDRQKYFLVQTPQVFRLDLILEAFDHAVENSIVATDESGLMEKVQQPVKPFDGDSFNIKVTTRQDLLLAEALQQIFHKRQT